MSDMYNKIDNKKTKKDTWLLIAVIFLIGFACLLISRIWLTQNTIYSLIVDLIGGFLVIAVPMEILKELFFKEDNLSSFENRINHLFESKIEGVLIQAKKFGLESIENSLPIKQLFDDLKAGDTLWWLDTFSPGHKQWLDNVEKAILRGAVINMLIPDPNSELCAMRADEIGGFYKPEKFTTELNIFIEDFTECKKFINKNTLGGDINIVLYNDLFGVPCYIVTRDDQPIYAYSSMYLTKPTGVDFPHFRWNQGAMIQILFTYVKNKFDKFNPPNRAISPNVTIS